MGGCTHSQGSGGQSSIVCAFVKRLHAIESPMIDVMKFSGKLYDFFCCFCRRNSCPECSVIALFGPHVSPLRVCVCLAIESIDVSRHVSSDVASTTWLMPHDIPLEESHLELGVGQWSKLPEKYLILRAMTTMSSASLIVCPPGAFYSTISTSRLEETLHYILNVRYPCVDLEAP